MRVPFQNRGDAFVTWGGDTTQMMQTKRELERLGVAVDVCLDARPDVSGYDLVHVFNMQSVGCSAEQLRNAKRQGRSVAPSTIYWDPRHLQRHPDRWRYGGSASRRFRVALLGRLPFLGVAKAASKHRRAIGPGSPARTMLRDADVLLPNSHAELEIMAQLFNMPQIRAKAFVVPNGVDEKEALQEAVRDAATPVTPEGASIPTPFVLEVGAVVFYKGQLRLLQALADSPQIPLVLLGRGLETPYWMACRRIAERRGNAWVLDAVPHEQVWSYYRAAKVYVLPSLRESPGLATLEAGVCGANCVVSIHGPVAEYFGPDVWYCDPDEPESVRAAVLAAWQAPCHGMLRERILASFTLRHAAEATLRAC